MSQNTDIDIKTEDLGMSHFIMMLIIVSLFSHATTAKQLRVQHVSTRTFIQLSEIESRPL